MMRLTLATTAAALATPLAAETVPQGCFHRSYDSAHLAAHPAQGVASLSLWIGHIEAYGTEDVYFWLEAQMADQGQAARDGVAGQSLGEGGLCHRDRAECYVDGDGGGFEIAAVSATGIEIATRGMRLVSAQYDDGGYDNTGEVSSLNENTTGITRYRLHRTHDHDCEGY